MAKTAPARGPSAQPKAPFPESVARLASVRMSLRLVEPSGHGPSGDSDDAALATAFSKAEPALQHHFDRRASRLVATASDGMDALMAGFEAGRVPSEEASRELADRIRRELAEISGIILA
jgi:hypothetical protein